MTMHLVGPYLTTTNYKKRKTKMTKAKQAALELRWREHNKFLKSIRLSPMTLEEFTDYLNGKRSKKPVEATPKLLEALAYRRDTGPRIPSLNSELKDLQHACAKKEPNRYTGTLIKGIATMHKSNAVPIINDEQAKEISQMRRN